MLIYTQIYLTKTAVDFVKFWGEVAGLKSAGGKNFIKEMNLRQLITWKLSSIFYFFLCTVLRTLLEFYLFSL